MLNLHHSALAEICPGDIAHVEENRVIIQKGPWWFQKCRG